MRISELQQRLEDVRQQYGDLRVTVAMYPAGKILMRVRSTEVIHVDKGFFTIFAQWWRKPLRRAGRLPEEWGYLPRRFSRRGSGK